MNLEILRAGLEELSSIQFQRKYWLATSGQISSFEEAVSWTFDDSGLDVAIEKGNHEPFDLQDIELFKELGELIRKTPSGIPRKELIHSSAMEAVRGLATRLLRIVQERDLPNS